MKFLLHLRLRSPVISSGFDRFVRGYRRYLQHAFIHSPPPRSVSSICFECFPQFYWYPYCCGGSGRGGGRVGSRGPVGKHRAFSLLRERPTRSSLTQRSQNNCVGVASPTSRRSCAHHLALTRSARLSYFRERSTELTLTSRREFFVSFSGGCTGRLSCSTRSGLHEECEPPFLSARNARAFLRSRLILW